MLPRLSLSNFKEINIISIKANVQYNDLIGTSTADISDYAYNSLEPLARSLEVDLDRYHIAGIKFYSGYAHSFSAKLLLNDTGNPVQPYIVSLDLELNREAFSIGLKDSRSY